MTYLTVAYNTTCMAKYIQKHFAIICDVSPPAISKAIKQGRLILVNNEIDLDNYINRAYYENRMSRLKRPMAPPPGAETPPVIPKKPAYVRKKHTKQRKSDDLDITLPSDDDITGSKLAYEIARIKSQTAKIDLDIAEKMEKLISRSRVDSYFAEFASVFSNMVLPMGQRLAKDICDEMKITDPAVLLRIQVLIDTENERAANEIKRIASKAIDS